MSITDIMRGLFDPRGRIDRKAMVWLALVILVAQAVVYGAGWLAPSSGAQSVPHAFEIIILWIGLCAAIKRLHDTGRGMVWVGLAIAATIVFSFVVVLVSMMAFGARALEPTQNAYWVILGLTMLPALAATIWLHVKQGDPLDNRYGPRPGPHGFSHHRCGAAFARA
ncbi:MAG: DUF805 domain-containing protein [Hyphomicrobiaceae bacterium]